MQYLLATTDTTVFHFVFHFSQQWELCFLLPKLTENGWEEYAQCDTNSQGFFHAYKHILVLLRTNVDPSGFLKRGEVQRPKYSSSVDSVVCSLFSLFFQWSFMREVCVFIICVFFEKLRIRFLCEWSLCSVDVRCYYKKVSIIYLFAFLQTTR